MLNKIWISFFLIGILSALVKLIGYGDSKVFKNMADALFDAGVNGFTISIGLTGAMCIWLGFMRIGEKGGAVGLLTRAISPLFRKLFPEIPKGHPAVGAVMMNISANMLGLDNAATPLGLKAMKELQELNPKKDTASNAQIMFLVLNTSGLTIVPVSVLALLSASGSSNPTEVFLPILIATFCATFVGLIGVALRQRIKLYDPVIIAYLGSILGFLTSLLIALHYFPQYTRLVTDVGGNLLIFGIIGLFFVLGIRNKVNLYDEFIEGAKDGFKIAVSIIPYLIAMLLAIAMFRASGAFDVLLDGIRWLLVSSGVIYTEFVDVLPVALMKPLSGGGARGLMVESISHFGVDSFQAKLAATLQGSTETTFYVIAVYFGSVGIKKTRYAIGLGLLADLAGIIAAILLAYYFYEV